METFVRTCLTSSTAREPVVTILESTSKVGRHLAMLLKQNRHIGELRLYDKDSSVTSVAEDLSHIDTKTTVKSFEGPSVLRYAVAEADIVLAVGGCRYCYKETFEETFEKNLDDVRNAALHLVEFNPKAIFCIAKPPIECFVPLVTEEYKKAGVYDYRKIIGVTTTGSMRVNSTIASYAGQDPIEVLCPIVGGISCECLVPVLSQSRPKGANLPRTLHKAIVNSEDEVLKLYGDCGSVSLLPALGISRFVNILLRALKGDTNCVDCAFINQTGHIGQFLPYMTSIVRFGRHGVLSSHMPKVNGEEAYILKKASHLIKRHIRLGEEFATGQSSLPQEKIQSPDEAVEQIKSKLIPADPDKPVLKCTQ